MPQSNLCGLAMPCVQVALEGARLAIRARDVGEMLDPQKSLWRQQETIQTSESEDQVFAGEAVVVVVVAVLVVAAAAAAGSISRAGALALRAAPLDQRWGSGRLASFRFSSHVRHKVACCSVLSGFGSATVALGVIIVCLFALACRWLEVEGRTAILPLGSRFSDAQTWPGCCFCQCWQ